MENKPNIAGKGPTWLFDLDYLTVSMNYHPVRSENQANPLAGQQEVNQNAGIEDIINARDSETKDESAQDCFVLPIWPSYSSTITPDLKTDEKRDGPREEEQKGAAKPSSTNIFSTVSTPAKASSTNLVNTVSIPVSTASPHAGLSLSDPPNPKEDDSEIPPLEDIYQHSTEGDTTSAVQTRSKLHKSSGAHAFVSYVQKQRRNNHKDFQHCLFACFLSQQEPKKISEAIEDESWVDVMQEELLQFEIQKVWVLVDLPYGKKAIGFLDPKYPQKVYKVVKALYGLHQAPRAWYATLSTFLLKNGYTKRVSSFDLESYSDSDYAGENLDRKSTTGGLLNLYKPISIAQFRTHSLSKLHSHLQALISLFTTISLSSTMAVLDSCPKHNMVAYLEKTEGNAEFHEIIDFLKRSSIHHALTVSPVVSTTFVEQFWTSAKSKTINNVRHITAKVAGKSVSISEASIRSDLLFDDADGIDSLPNQAIFNAITLNRVDAQERGDKVIGDEDKEIDEIRLSTEYVVSTDKEVVSTDKEKVSTRQEKQIEGTDEQIEGTEEHIEGTEEHIEGTEEQVESTDGQRKGTEDHTEEEIAAQATQTPTQTHTSTVFGDDETIAKVLLNMSQAKAVSREKEKGVELKDIEEADKPRPTSTRSLLTLKPLPKIDPKDKGKKKIEEEDESESESDGIPQAEKKFKQLESDEELARKIQEEWEGEEERNRIAEEKAANEALIRNFDDIKARIEADRLLAEKLQEQEREQFTIEERAKFLHDTIAAQRKFLAQQRSEAIRNKPPTKNQLRNQMMTYLKHVGNFKHAELKIKKFEEVQALYEKIKRSDEDFISIGSAEDERLIKRMNEKGVDLSKSEVIKEESKEEVQEGVQEESKEEESTKKRKLGTRKKMKSRKRRYIQNTSEDDSDKENDELRLHLTIAPDEEKEVDYEILDRKYPIKEWKTECLGTKPQADKAEHFEEINQNVDWNIVSWKLHGSSGVHTLVTETGLVIHMLVEKKYPLRKKVLMQMLKLKLESEEDSTMALELIRFIKKILAELEPKG
ncbi:ribonuclease H-like domain-containing protein [Tanacetum coccineum]